MEATHFDQQGDVRLIVTKGDERLGYVVNSVILRLASPVFAALIGPHFREGNTLKARAAGDALIDIPLPEDDADALKLFLDIAHMRKVPDHVDVISLIELAVIVDEYQCARVCQSHAEGWMKEEMAHGYNAWTSEFAEYFGLSIVFGSGEIAWDRLDATRFASLISQDMIDEIGTNRVVYNNEIRDRCVYLVRDLHALIRWEEESTAGNAHSEHRHAASLIAIYYSKLAEFDVMGRPKISPLQTMYHLCSVVRTIQRLAPDMEVTDCTACCFIRTIAESLYQAIKKVFCHQTGPTLRCATMSRVKDARHGAQEESDEGGISGYVFAMFSHLIGNKLLEDDDDAANSFEQLVGGEFDLD